jgi:hypothetical protein
LPQAENDLGSAHRIRRASARARLCRITRKKAQNYRSIYVDVSPSTNPSELRARPTHQAAASRTIDQSEIENLLTVIQTANPSAPSQTIA